MSLSKIWVALSPKASGRAVLTAIKSTALPKATRSDLSGMTPVQAIHVGTQEFVFYQRIRGAVLRGPSYVVKAHYGGSQGELEKLKRGLTVDVDGSTAKIWRPRFGLRVRDRVVKIEVAGSVFTIIPMSLRRYEIVNAEGLTVLRRVGRTSSIENDLDPRDMTVLLFVHAQGIALTSFITWHLCQGI